MAGKERAAFLSASVGQSYSCLLWGQGWQKRLLFGYSEIIVGLVSPWFLSLTGVWLEGIRITKVTPLSLAGGWSSVAE